MTRIMCPQKCKKPQDMHRAMEEWEVAIREHESRFCETVAESVKMSALQHMIPRQTGRIIATIEAATVDGEVETLERIQRMPGIVLAEMVQHHIDVESAAESDDSRQGGVPKTFVDT